MDDFYNQIAAEMDVRRDQAYQEVNEEFLGPDADVYHQVVGRLDEHEIEEYNARKQEVRWEVAW